MTRPTLHYVALSVLFLCAVAYQIRALEYRFPGWFRLNHVAWPFLLNAEDQPDFSLVFVRPNAREAGLHEHDTLLAINGRAVTGRTVLADALASAHPGDSMRATVLSKGVSAGPSERTVSVPLVSEPGWGSPVGVLLIVVMPALCLALGFWVAAVRPQDVRAWLLLALMLSLASFFNSFPEFWGPKARLVGTLYYSFQQGSWLAWLFLLGFYFPEPFPARARWQWWKWLQWAPLLLWMVLAAAYVVAAVGELYSVASVTPTNRFIEWVQVPRLILGACLVGGFLACIVAKYRLALSADSRRRLRVLYAGAIVSLMPLTVTFTAAQVHHVSPEQYFPPWLMIGAYLCFSLLPVTLAYVIVVHRAMDIRVVIRQGLQYAAARGTVRVVRGALSIGLIWASVYLLQHSSTRSPVFYAIIGASATVGFGLRRLGDWLRAWTDRRFFRDAYNAEQILAELSEKVRTIVETGPLLETVAARIAESLHVPRIAVLTDGSGPYRPAYALGYGGLPDVSFPEQAATIRQLCQQKEPARVYFDDPDSWIYRTSGLDEEERAKLAALRAELLLPLAVKEKLLGFISLSQKLSEEPYSGNDLRLLKSVAAQTGLALENARLTATIAEAIAEREKLNREVEIAREVQERLFPQKLAVVSGLDYFGKCRPALGVGGDYYDLLALPEGKLGIAIGDVSGKGISAALMMATLQASLRGEAARAPANLAALMSNLNRLVYEATHVNRYATFFYGQYEPATRTLVYVNAGHNPPMLFRKGPGTWQLERLEEGGVVVGLLPEFAYRQASVTLALNDILVAFTDGISEAMNPRDEEWGEEQLMEAIKACDGLSARTTIDHLMATADAFAAGAPQHDDMTLVVLRVVPAP